MKDDRIALWQSLLDRNIVTGDCPELSHSDAPWYVRTLLAFSGWLAALFLMLFTGLVLEAAFDESIILSVVGSIMILAAYLLLRLAKNEFREHLALAVSLAGQALLAWVIFAEISDDQTALAIIALLEISFALLLPNYLHRVLTAFVAAFAFYHSLGNAGLPYVGDAMLLALTALLWLNEFSFAGFASQIRAIAYGLTLALIPLKGSAIFGYGSMTWHHEVADTVSWLQPWMGEVLVAIVLACVVWHLLKRQGISWPDHRAVLALLATLLISAAAMKAPGIPIGVVILLAGFAGSNSVLTGLGIVSLLFYSSSYYYLTDLTLLNKAQILLATGLVLLSARWLLKHLLSRPTDSINQRLGGQS